ncbi:bifunctional metallophosphatase/5'-nucleotidase [Altererythrobacter aquiaggeris]|uniref:bifunctional metallophosphatase/5'-nucleotidase n=1 Tax=Aestuarierythrobacter aquiaggeris TaxID=1898396 RepID=UPI00301886DE
MIRKLIAVPAVLALGACATVPTATQITAPVTVRIIGINDFHGNLEPPVRAVTVRGEGDGEVRAPAGGAAYLASAIASIKAKNENYMVISAGDMISGSPLVSSLFLDEPTIGVMNRIGIDFNAVGNHEFDRGSAELQRIQNGGCEVHTPREPCRVEAYRGADFRFLAANVTNPDGSTIFPAFGIKQFGTGASQVSVGVIGLTLEDTPTLVTPGGIEGLTFAEESATINALIPQLEAQGADAIVVSIHQGLYTEAGYNDASCAGVSGRLLDILAKLDPRVDLVISGHTHRAYICDYSAIDPTRNFLVTSASWAGTMLTDIALTIDPASGNVTARSAENVIVQNDGITSQVGAAEPLAELQSFAANAEIAAYVARYAEAASSFATRAVGKLSGIALDPPAVGETALGNLIADAQLAATRSAGAQIALMNNTGIRADLVPAEDGTITFGAIYSVQPFSNTLVTKTFSGAQVIALLEQQFDDKGVVQTFSVSEGFGFAYDRTRPGGQRIGSVTLNGAPLDPEKKYRVTMNGFLASGGDSFTMFDEGTDAVVGPLDLDSLEMWFAAAEMRQLPATGRLTDQTPRD